jgi:ribosomal protein L37AE/L43A
MQDIKPPNAICPFCKNPKIHKRQNAYGYHCKNCKVVFREPLFIETHNAEAV